MDSTQLFTVAILALIVTPFVSVVSNLIVLWSNRSISAIQRERDLEDRALALAASKLASENALKAAREASDAADAAARAAKNAAGALKEVSAAVAQVSVEVAETKKSSTSNAALIQDTGKNTVKSLTDVHEAVLVVGEKADAAYTEANHINLKLQAVLDAGNISAGIPTTPVTAAAIRDAVDYVESKPDEPKKKKTGELKLK